MITTKAMFTGTFWWNNKVPDFLLHEWWCFNKLFSAAWWMYFLLTIYMNCHLQIKDTDDWCCSITQLIWKESKASIILSLCFRICNVLPTFSYKFSKSSYFYFSELCTAFAIWILKKHCKCFRVCVSSLSLIVFYSCFICIIETSWG